MRVNPLGTKFVLTVGTFLCLFSFGWAQSASQSPDADLLKPGYPQRYTVVKGDTLWHIANRFLKDPWRWPVIWKQNETIKNPHLIYPGDVLVMTNVGGVPRLRVLRMEPQVREESLRDAITTIPPGAILPFLNAPLVLDEGELDEAGHVVVGVDENILLGNLSRFFARNLQDPEHDYYHVFFPGGAFIEPDTREVLGYEAAFRGDAKVLEHGEVARMEVIEATQEIRPGDRLLPAEKQIGYPYYFPRSPENEVNGRIIHNPTGVNEMGKYSIAVMSVGEREGIEPGHVLRIRHFREKYKDPVTGETIDLPEDDSGLIMVFRVFEKVSYGLILKASRSIELLDRVETP